MDKASLAIRMESQVECVDALSVTEASIAAYISDGCSTPGYKRSIPLSMAAYMSDGCSTPSYSRIIPFFMSILAI